MRNLLIVIGLIGGTFVSAFGQWTPVNQPTNGETPQQVRDSRERDIQANQRIRVIQDPRRDPQYNIDREKYKTIERTDILVRTKSKSPVLDPYRKPTKEERAAVMPEQADLDKFAEFLRQPKTGLIKLITDIGCADNRNIVVATADCLKYTMPGAGTSYAFRVKDYRTAELSDLTFTDNNFKSLGAGIQGILTTLGDIPLEKVDSQTNGLNFLINFQPETNNKKIRESRDEFANGVTSNYFTYRSEWKVIENTTYALRSIAYGNFGPDKRNDIIVVFRIVRKSDDGSLTILWKELARKDSPKRNN